MRYRLLKCVALGATLTLGVSSGLAWADDSDTSTTTATTTQVEPSTTESTTATTTPGSVGSAGASGDDASTTTAGGSDDSTSSTTAAADAGATGDDGTTGDVSTDDPPTTTADPNASTETGQEVVSVTGMSLAVSTSGGNQSSTTGGTANGAASADGTNQVSTGSADATGTQDSNQINQQATTSLSGDATADILQIVLIFNVGAAFANSGANGVDNTGGAGGAGATTTGNATAVGNDSATYLTQGATADATQIDKDSSSQLAIAMRVGVSSADSGQNVITFSQTPVGTGGGSIGSGNAKAVGNDSMTAVNQLASATGSGYGSLTIEQQVLVLNLGIAVANSGLNQIRGAAGALLITPNDILAGEMFKIMLPALLASAQASSGAGGSGSIASGDATAIGNKSTTLIDQTANASAAGNGNATIQQQAVVLNLGVAGANTGDNSTGADAPLDESSSAVVAQLGVFLNNLIAQIHAWTAGAAGSAGMDGISVPLGDLLIGINSTLAGTVSNSTDGKTRTRQVTAVVSLGVSKANSGLNSETSTVGTTNASSTVTAGGTVQSSISTGQADATNGGVTVICQRDDAPDVVCLTPPTTPVSVVPEPEVPGVVAPGVSPDGGVLSEAPIAMTDTVSNLSPTPAVVTPAAVAAQGGQLPQTGVDLTPFLLIGLAMLAIGSWMALWWRRQWG